MRWTAVIAALLAALGAAARAQPVRFELRVSPTAGTTAEEFVATLEISLRGVEGPERVTAPRFTGFVLLEERGGPHTEWSHDPALGQEIRHVEIRRFRLRPERVGRLEIGPARLVHRGKTYETRPVTVEVRAAAPAGDAGPSGDVASAPPGFVPPDPATADPTFLYAFVDRPRVYQGEQVTATWLLYTRADVLRFDPSPVHVEGAAAVKLFEARGHFTYHEELLGGRSFAVAVCARTAFFPTRAGPLVVPPFAADVATLFTSLSTPLKLQSAALTVDVQPLPAGAPAGFDPAFVGAFSLEAQLDRTVVPAGESVMLTLVLRGPGGLLRSRAPALALDDFRVFPARDFGERIDTATTPLGVERRYQYLLTPSRGGRLTVGPVEISVFDPEAGAYARVHAPPVVLDVAGDPAQVVPGAGRDNVILRDIRPPVEAPVRLGLAATRFFSSPLFAAALAAPPGVYLLVLAVGRLRARLGRETPAARRRRARGRGRRRLREATLALRLLRPADFHAAVAALLLEQAEERAGRPLGALTREAVAAALDAAGVPASLLERFLAELEGADFARFAPAPSTAGEMRATLRRVRVVVDDLARLEARR